MNLFDCQIKSARKLSKLSRRSVARYENPPKKGLEVKQMGRNVDLIRMCGLPKEIKMGEKKVDIEQQLRDYDIDDDATNPDDGVWVLSFGGLDDDEEWEVQVKFKVSGLIMEVTRL